MIRKSPFAKSLLMVIGCLTVLIEACAPPKPGVYKNDKIPSSAASKLHGMNSELLSALKANDPERLENMMSKEMIDQGINRLRTTEKISLYMKVDDYELMSDYYIVNKFLGKDTLRERNMGINNFNLPYERSTPEMYIAFFLPKKSPEKYLITAVYYKYNYGWKVGYLECKPYAENGKTAPELINYANELLKKGYWLDASNAASYAQNCLRPSDYWVYLNEKDVLSFSDSAFAVLAKHYKLPLVIKQVKTQPKIWRVRVERNGEGSFPNINYISKVSLRDTKALEAENKEVGKAIGDIFSGIDKDKKYIYYTIYNETAKKGVDYRDHYDLKQTLN